MSSTVSKKSPKRPAGRTSISPPQDTERYFESDLKSGSRINNIFEALEDDPKEAARLTLLADMSIELERHIRKHGWTQKEAAKQLGITQPRVSDLLRGRIDLFSVDYLVGLLSAVGIKVEVSYKKAA